MLARHLSWGGGGTWVLDQRVADRRSFHCLAKDVVQVAAVVRKPGQRLLHIQAPVIQAGVPVIFKNGISATVRLSSDTVSVVRMNWGHQHVGSGAYRHRGEVRVRGREEMKGVGGSDLSTMEEEEAILEEDTLKSQESGTEVRVKGPYWTRGAKVTSQGGEDDADRLRVLFAAGGTGGHIYPAVAIADEILKLEPSAMVLFAGTRERMEWKVVPSSGYPIRPIPAVSIRRPITSLVNLLLPFRLLYALWRCWKLIGKIKPHIVIGTGGYVAGPACLIAAIRGCPVVIQEQNAYAGITNRILGWVAATVIFIAFADALRQLPKKKCVLAGNPTRAGLLKVSREEGRKLLLLREKRDGRNQSLLSRERTKESDGCVNNLDDDYRKGAVVICVFGGSLGARKINVVMEEVTHNLLDEDPQLFILWQTGSAEYRSIARRIKSHPRLALLPFVERMDLVYAAADIVVGRAGAITCSELLVTGTPSILIPSPNVAEDHQLKNALAMVDAGAAELLLEKDLTANTLVQSIHGLLYDEKKRMTMRTKALNSAAPNAAKDIAMAALELARARKEEEVNRR